LAASSEQRAQVSKQLGICWRSCGRASGNDGLDVLLLDRAVPRWFHFRKTLLLDLLADALPGYRVRNQLDQDQLCASILKSLRWNGTGSYSGIAFSSGLSVLYFNPQE